MLMHEPSVEMQGKLLDAGKDPGIKLHLELKS